PPRAAQSGCRGPTVARPRAAPARCGGDRSRPQRPGGERQPRWASSACPGDEAMNEGNYTNVTFEEIEIGKPVTVEHPVTQPEVEAMALVSGDLDPYYLEPGARETEKGVASAQAGGAGAILSSLLNRRMPGPGTRILEQNLRFRGTIRTGDPVTASVTAKSKNHSGNLVVFDCLVKQGASELIAGSITVEPPTRHIAYENVP